MASDMKWKDAIEKVLKQAGTSMHYKDIADQINALGLRKSLGATPAATVNSMIVTSISDQGDNSPFIKTGKGEYILRAVEKESPKLQNVDMSGDEAQYDIITSFGMFWRRGLVQWKRTPRILGVQQLGAKSVDFSNQQGI